MAHCRKSVHSLKITNSPIPVRSLDSYGTFVQQVAGTVNSNRNWCSQRNPYMCCNRQTDMSDYLTCLTDMSIQCKLERMLPHYPGKGRIVPFPKVAQQQSLYIYLDVDHLWKHLCLPSHCPPLPANASLLPSPAPSCIHPILSPSWGKLASGCQCKDLPSVGATLFYSSFPFFKIKTFLWPPCSGPEHFGDCALIH